MRIDDGFPTTIEFSASPGVMGVLLWEKNVTPIGLSGGGANDTSTMRNTRMRTKNPKSLLDVSDMSVTMAYDPECYQELLDMIQLNQLITIWWPDGSFLYFWGWIDEFQPNEVSEGEQPDADVTIIASNQRNDKVEVQPHYEMPTS